MHGIFKTAAHLCHGLPHGFAHAIGELAHDLLHCG